MATPDLVFDALRHVSAAEAKKLIPARGGKRFATLFRHGSLHVELFAPRGRDAQRPHVQDELYVVLQGKGIFLSGTRRVTFGPGDLLFAAAGEVHRFERFTEDLYAWVVFYGPDGGERAKAQPGEAEGEGRAEGAAPGGAAARRGDGAPRG
jgi:mannose-6-phosphate isomerase-like protein (cupin superfamily)